jgi:hypothetical protein
VLHLSALRRRQIHQRTSAADHLGRAVAAVTFMVALLTVIGHQHRHVRPASHKTSFGMAVWACNVGPRPAERCLLSIKEGCMTVDVFTPARWRGKPVPGFGPGAWLGLRDGRQPASQGFRVQASGFVVCCELLDTAGTVMMPRTTAAPPPAGAPRRQRRPAKPDNRQARGS